ncbi:MAG: hypothetical protein M1596_04255 [Firmicutes bacterium]|nr:hypothetical protein [Bacillota bacterium]
MKPAVIGGYGNTRDASVFCNDMVAILVEAEWLKRPLMAHEDDRSGCGGLSWGR